MAKAKVSQNAEKILEIRNAKTGEKLWPRSQR